MSRLHSPLHHAEDARTLDSYSGQHTQATRQARARKELPLRWLFSLAYWLTQCGNVPLVAHADLEWELADAGVLKTALHANPHAKR